MAANRLNVHALDDCKERWGLTSDAQVARKLGVDPRTLKSYKSGETDPPVKVLLLLRKLTGWPLDGLVIEGMPDNAA